LTIERGLMALPQAPGLGVDLDEAALDKYVVERRKLCL
jgi:L-alanine-DL-glutamate epimerase-like enolase superfamily enzyme